MPQLRRRLPNAWGIHDERFEGLLATANEINDAVDLAGGSGEIVLESELEPDLYPMWTPLRLAGRMRSAA